MRGYQRTRTKAQDLVEIAKKQDGFLSGLNLDMPKVDVGDTQLTVLKNAIPYRDRVEARGGIKPQNQYKIKGSSGTALLFDVDSPPMYDSEFDEFFFIETDTSSTSAGIIYNQGKKDLSTTMCYDYVLSNDGTTSAFANNLCEQRRLKDGYLFSDYNGSTSAFTNNFIEKRTEEDDYFVRPLISDATATDGVTSGNFMFIIHNDDAVFPKIKRYKFNLTFVRMDGGDVVAESLPLYAFTDSTSDDLDVTFKPFSLYQGGTDLRYPDEYFDSSFNGEENFYTHIRFYRTKNIGMDVSVGGSVDYRFDYYHVGDYELNSMPSLPLTSGSNVKLDLNISDKELISDSSRVVLWQAGYQKIPGSPIACSSSGMLLFRNEARKNEFIYCPVGSGGNRKYSGWYNPLFQYGSVDGDITQMLDMGSYVVITTSTKTYYVDTVNYIEDEGQRASGIFTPILNETVLISDLIGVNIEQKNAFVKSSTGLAIGITSDGEIRQFGGYQWGTDLSLGKVHSITKGIIKRNNLYCQGAFVNDAYYLGFPDERTALGFTFPATRTLRLGTTEESGFGFCEFEGEIKSNDDPTPILGAGWNPVLGVGGLTNHLKYFTRVNNSLNIFNSVFDDQIRASVCLYTGDNFSTKINKDIFDRYTRSTGNYESTFYSNIPVEIEFPEDVADSENYILYFLKSNFFLRADKFTFKVTDENLRGYEIDDTDLTNVSLSDTTFGADARIGESEDIVASNEGFSPNKAVVFSRDVTDNRIRLSFRGAGSGFQLVGMETRYKRHDRTEFEESLTQEYIKEINTDMFCRIDETMTNKAIGDSRFATLDIGAPIEGSRIGHSSKAQLYSGVDFAESILGPSGENDGLHIILSSYNFEAVNFDSIPTFTVMFWSKEAFPDIILGFAENVDSTLEFRANVSDGMDVVIGNNNYPTSASISQEWQHYAFTKAENESMKLYVDATFIQSIGTPTDLDINLINNIQIGSPNILANVSYVSDIRMYNKSISLEALNLYKDNVINNSGDYFK
jgi:hypothetical protein